MESSQSLAQQTGKNVGWNLTTGLVTKIGGLIFTIILARMLMPELFGVYNLVLSVVIIAFMFTDLGIGNTATRYLSEFIGKKEGKKARSYFKYFLKIKLVLSFFAILAILAISKFLAYNIFNKPIIFFPLLVSSLYIFVSSLGGLFKVIFIAKKELSKIFILEIVFVLSKVVFAALAIYTLSEEFVIAGIFIALALAAFITLLINLILIKEKRNFIFGETEPIEKKRVWTYLESMSLVSLSLVFFGSIDTLMLGRFVETAFIGYYRVALSLVVTTASLFGFPNVLLPVFTQIHSDRFERAFEKVARYLVIFIIPAVAGLAVIAKYFILAIYGKEYLLATSSLYVLAPIILISPFVVLYSSIFQAQEKTNVLAKAVIISLIINIVLNYILIKSLLTISQEYVIVGVGLATFISRGFYLIFLSNKSANLFKTKIPWRVVLKSILAALVMAMFLVWFNSIVDMNIYLGILEIFLGAGIYFIVLWMFKGIGREDINFLKNLRKIR